MEATSGFTPQMRALGRLQALYGLKHAWTEAHLDYVWVGCWIKGQRYSGMGDTWEEAIAQLQAKTEAARELCA